MEIRQLGTSDLKISTVTFGAWAIGGLFWGGSDERDAIAAIRRAIDEGVTTIDTAPMYGCGLSEELVGRAIKGRRDQITILDKFGLRWDSTEGTHYFDLKAPDGKMVRVHRVATKASIVHECEQSLRRLGVDCIDLYQHHWPDPAAPIEETFGAVEQLRQAGKIRWVGVCNYNVAQAEAVRRAFPIVSLQPPYSMVKRDAEAELLPWCRANGLGAVVYSPLQMGLLTGKVTADRVFPPTDVRSTKSQFSPENRRRVNAFLDKLRPIADAHGVSLANVVIAWTLARPGITAALVGARDAAQAAENAKAGSLKLSPDDLAMIDRELAGLKLEK
jgi:aryl-alcohol dehydrogenase-like predicted oxidoreductase